jgi:hypothetical protein
MVASGALGGEASTRRQQARAAGTDLCVCAWPAMVLRRGHSCACAAGGDAAVASERQEVIVGDVKLTGGAWMSCHRSQPVWIATSSKPPSNTTIGGFLPGLPKFRVHNSWFYCSVGHGLQNTTDHSFKLVEVVFYFSLVIGANVT